MSSAVLALREMSWRCRARMSRSIKSPTPATYSGPPLAARRTAGMNSSSHTLHSHTLSFEARSVSPSSRTTSGGRRPRRWLQCVSEKKHHVARLGMLREPPGRYAVGRCFMASRAAQQGRDNQRRDNGRRYADDDAADALRPDMIALDDCDLAVVLSYPPVHLVHLSFDALQPPDDLVVLFQSLPSRARSHPIECFQVSECGDAIR